MKRKYAGMYYSVKKEERGWIWKIYFNYTDKEPCQSSLDNEDEEDKYNESSGMACCTAIDAIIDYYT